MSDNDLWHSELLKIVRGVVAGFVKDYRFPLGQTTGTIPSTQLPPATGTGGPGGPGAVRLSDDDPADVGTAPDPGTATPVSRGDHVHSLPTTGVTPGAYGDWTHAATFTVDAQGRLTGADEVALPTTVALSDANPANVGTTAAGSGTAASRDDHVHSLPNTGVSAGTYGDATHVSQIAIDAKGRITAASNVAISGGGGGGSATAAGQIMMSLDGSTMTAVLPIVGPRGWLFTEEGYLLVTAG